MEPGELNIILNINGDQTLAQVQESSPKWIECRYCHKEFKSKDGYKYHVKNEHSEEFKCDSCGEQIFENKNSEKHDTKCSGLKAAWNMIMPPELKLKPKVKQHKEYPCIHCPYRAKRKTDLKLHCDTSHQEKECRYCYKKFKSKYGCEYHVKNKHSESVTNIECRYCDKKFTSKLGYKYHEKNTHSETVTNIECRYCDKKFTSKFSYKQHVKSEHSETIRNYQRENIECRYCDKKFTSRFGYKYHIKIEHSEKFKCESCGEQIFENANSEKHDLKCSGLKATWNMVMPPTIPASKINSMSASPLECLLCNATKFKNKQQYSYHMKSKPHLNKIEMSSFKFSCEHCDRKFNHEKGLNYHIMSKHTEKDLLYNYLCDQCEKSFSDKHYLNVHVSRIHGKKLVKEKHEDKEAYACIEDKCNSEFTTSQGYQYHWEKQHLGKSSLPVDPLALYNCTDCNKGFKSQNGYNYHLESKHANPNKDDDDENTEKEKRLNQEKSHGCGLCDFKASNKISLNIHIFKQHKEYPCIHCPYKAKQRTDLKLHCDTSHQEKEKSGKKSHWQCYGYDDCKRQFKHYTRYLHHRKYAHEGLRYSCEFCDFKGKTKRGLAHHMTTSSAHAREEFMRESDTHAHEGLQFSCQFCDFKGKTKRGLAHHMTTSSAHATEEFMRESDI